MLLASRAVLVRVAAAGAQVTLAAIVGRSGGAGGLGQFYTFLALISFAGGLGSGGLPMRTLRDVADLIAAKRAAEAYASWRNAMRVTIGVGTGLSTVAWIGNESLRQSLYDGNASGSTLLLTAVGILPLMVLALSAETLKGLRKAEAALLLQFAFPPVVAVAGLSLHGWFLGSPPDGLPIQAYFAGLTTASVVAAGLAAWTFRETLGAANLRLSSVARRPSGAFWTVQALSQSMSQVPTLLLSIAGSATAVGLFGIATRLVSLASLVLMGVASVYSPRIVSSFRARRPRELRRLLRETQLLGVGGYVPLFIVFCFGGSEVLALFGEDLTAALVPLLILASGQLINSATGTVTYFNLMTSGERFEALGHIIVFGALVAAWIASGASTAAQMSILIAVLLALKNFSSLVRAYRALSNIEALARHA